MGALMTTRLLSWKLVFHGSQGFVPGIRRQDARQVAGEWGYKFYLWVDEVYWVATDERAGVKVENLF
jgi:hypothetical protein